MRRAAKCAVVAIVATALIYVASGCAILVLPFVLPAYFAQKREHATPTTPTATAQPRWGDGR